LAEEQREAHAPIPPGRGDRPSDDIGAEPDPTAPTISASLRPEIGREAGGAEGRTKRPADSLRCTEFGEYRIVCEVARGAMGIVYRAEQKRLGREVALKVLLAGEHASEGEVRRFTREAQALGRLRHPNIVPIHDIGEVDGRHYFTMDFVEGQTLSMVLQERRLTVTEALHIIEQVSDAVAAAHTRGVIHRDIKPSNIMLDGDGGVHIMDFGLAKSAGTDSKHTRDGTTIGTPAYMPPEQARGELSRVDERSDVYSIGAVLYELLSGRPPFGGCNLLEIVLAVINEEPPRPRSVNSRLPRDLETIIVKCMEKDPARRYQTAIELRDELRRFRSGEPIRAQPPSLHYLLRKRLRKHRVVLAACAAVLLAAGAALAYVVRYRQLVEEGLVEGTRAKWVVTHGCAFAPEETAALWERPRASFPDCYLAPVSAVQKNEWAQGRELVFREPIYGSARASLEFTLRSPLGRRTLALGFYGEPVSGGGRERVACFVRISSGRMELAASLAPDDPTGRPRIVADCGLPPIGAGSVCRVVVERDGIQVRCTLEQVSGGNRVGLGELAYAHPLLSNYRYRNLWLLLRGDEDLAVWNLVTVERLFLPRRSGSALVGADGMFMRGDYNGALSEYSAIIAPPAEGEDAPGEAERAAAYLRLGFYHEIKGGLDEALNSYEQVRTRFKGEESEELQFIRGQALLREVAVACRSGRPERAFSLLAEVNRLGVEHLAGPWKWDLCQAFAELARAGGQAGLARELAAALQFVRGSAVAGRSVAEIGVALQRSGKSVELEKLVADWSVRLGAEPVPLLEWARLSVQAGYLDNGLALFRRGRELLGEGSGELVFYAIQTCEALIARREFAKVARLVSAAGPTGLQSVFLKALAQATKAQRSQALDLLRAGAVHWPNDPAMAAAAVSLAETMLAQGRIGSLRQVDEAYHTPQLARVYARAVLSLVGPDGSPDDLVGLLREAAALFGPDHPDVGQAAAEAATEYAACRNPGDHGLLLRICDAYPASQNAVNLLAAIQALTAQSRWGQAGEVFAFAQVHMGADVRLTAAAHAVLLGTVPADGQAAFLDAVARVEPALAARPADLAYWRIELAGYHLLLGAELAAAEAYKRAWEAKSGRPSEAATEAMLRYALLIALMENPGFGELAEARAVLGRLAAAQADGNSRASLLALVAQAKAGSADEIERRASRLKVANCEVQVALAASASLAGDRVARANYLRLAWTALQEAGGSRVWPYELVRFASEEAQRSRG
jgi:tetratricopeptide (TPR) repeat protein